MRSRIVIFICLTALLAAPVAAAQFGSRPGDIPAPAPAAPLPTPVDDRGNGISNGQIMLLFAGGVAVLLAIAWFVLRDARAHAPVPDHEAERRSEQVRLTREREQREHKQRSRKKSKAARHARRKNRPR